jgi:FtsH-binding integral membrane protein
MKKLPLMAFLIGSIFIASITLNAISFLAKLAPKPEGLNIDPLIHGQLLQLLVVKEFWSHYPALPTAHLLLSLNTLILMGLLLGFIFYYLAYRQKYQPLIVSTVLLLTALIPYGIGLLVLAKNGEPGNAGPWLAFMLIGVFYASTACALFSGIQMMRSWTMPQYMQKAE